MNPELIKKIIIPIEKLADGKVYFIKARNASIGVWKEANKSFEISRSKFGSNYLFDETHYDASEAYGTAIPFHETNDKISMLTDDLKKLELLNELETKHEPTRKELYKKLLEENIPSLKKRKDLRND